MNGRDDHLNLDQLRQKYRPEHVRLLFVGESPPAGGTFFYHGNSLLAKYTREAFSRVYGPYPDMAQFLTDFRDRGCYLVDLCREPVDGLPKPQKRAARRAGIPGLADEMLKLQPEKIVAVMKGIEPHVLAAAADAGLSAHSVNALPFPAMSHQRQYVEGLVPVLRRCLVSNEPGNAGKPPEELAPALTGYTRDVLFGEVWERPGLSKRDRSLITVATLVALYRTNELPFHLKRALDNGVTPDELIELITHLAFYSGWPTAHTALDIARGVFAEQGG